jgi:hypothetical protein
MGHLNFIHEQHDKNLMPVENLAAIWGPTLMHVEVLDNLANWYRYFIVTSFTISHYCTSAFIILHSVPVYTLLSHAVTLK